MNQTHLARSIKKTEGQSKYDHYVKQLISNKQVLARILKYTVEEFKGYDIDTIIGCIEGEPEVASHPFYSGRVSEKITGLNVESIILHEGERTFDIRFYAIVPGQIRIKIILNVEAQKEYNQVYCIETRGVFYCARMISEQLDTEFIGDNYQDIKKVYSIWICMETPEVYANTITNYSLKKEDVYGIFKGKERYDLISVVLIRLSKNETEDKKHRLLQMLNVLLSHKMDAETKQKRLQKEFDMKMQEEEKGVVNQMCNLSEIIVEETTERVTKEVTCRNLVESVHNIIESFDVSLEKACEVMKTTVDEYMGARNFLRTK